MKLYNTMSQKKEEFIPIGDTVRMYNCGPTVYNLIHVGNARNIVVFETLRRALRYLGYKVKFAQNFTDIDDKIIRKANEENIPWIDVAEKYIAEYRTDAHGLGVRDADVHPRATENLAGIIDIITTLIDRGYAYQAGGDVYYRTSAFPGYGKLSHQKRDELLAGARIETGDIKESPTDFALWKGVKPGEPSWDSPWGPGRPGWHIECSAMNRAIFGDTLDIHCGGADLPFPHHENEIAQSEGATGKPLANYWLHNGFLQISGERMGKSMGNAFMVRDAAKEYGYDTLRAYLLMSHYRSPMNYAPDILVQCRQGLDRIKTAYRNFVFLAANGSDTVTDAEKAFISSLPDYRKGFKDSLEDDFNTADAFAVLFDFVRDANTVLASEKPSKACAEAALSLLGEFDSVLGILYLEKEQSAGSDNSILDALLAERQEARANKNWKRSDEIRDEIKALGYIVEDTKQGQKLIKQ